MVQTNHCSIYMQNVSPFFFVLCTITEANVYTAFWCDWSTVPTAEPNEMKLIVPNEDVENLFGKCFCLSYWIVAVSDCYQRGSETGTRSVLFKFISQNWSNSEQALKIEVVWEDWIMRPNVGRLNFPVLLQKANFYTRFMDMNFGNVVGTETMETGLR